MKAKQLVLLTALWLSALVFPPERALTSDYPGTGEQITPFFAAREAYAVVPFLNEPGTGRGYFATAAEEMATSSLPGGVDTESQKIGRAHV